jgi:stringent starvation protein B
LGRPTKQEAFLALMQEGWTSLHLDARRAGVVVPPHLKNEAHLVLQYGHDLPIPIPDLAIDEYGVSATLSFARQPHHTVIPWSAVYVVALDDGRGILYQEDIPDDVSVLATRRTGDGAPLHELGQPGVGVGDGVQHGLDGGLAHDGGLHNGHAAEHGGPGVSAAASVPATPAVRKLRAVPYMEDDAAVPAAFDGAGEAPPRRRRRPQLRLVK